MLFLRFSMFRKRPVEGQSEPVQATDGGMGGTEPSPVEEKKEKKPKGVTLSDHLQGQPLPASEWCFSLMEQLCDKIKEAHKEKRSHGTLTLGKIRVEQNPKLTDILGLETETDKKTTNPNADEQEERLRYWRESPTYAAPETQQHGTDIEIDGRADVYSLGVVLYEMLTGAVPVSYPPVLLQDANPKYKGFDGLDEIILTALAPDPEDRYASVQHFWEAIQEAKEASKGPKSLKWSDVRKTIKKKLKKYLRKKMVKLIQKEMKLWVKQGFGGKGQVLQAGGKEAAKQATKQAVDQVARQTAQAMAKQAGSTIYSAAATKSAAAAATSTASATVASGTAVLVTKGALLVAGTTVGAVVGTQGVEAVSKLPVIQRIMQQRQTPPPTLAVHGRSGHSQSTGNSNTIGNTTTQTLGTDHNLKGQASGSSRTGSVLSTTQAKLGALQTGKPTVQESCPDTWIRLNLTRTQQIHTQVTLMQGAAKRLSFGYCIPPQAQQVMFEYPGRIQCIVRLDGRIKQTLSIRLQRDRYQILPPDYCVVR